MPLQNSLNFGSRHPYVLTVQQQLVALGFSLPRFGADGVLGDETLSAYGKFLISRGLLSAASDVPMAITRAGARALEASVLVVANNALTENFFDERAKHPHSGRSISMPYRKWSKITSVVLHQTAAKIGETPASWHGVPIHFCVTRAGKIIQLYDLTEICNHANSLNRSSVGIEIDGWYAGIEGRPETLWQPQNQNVPRRPMDLPAVQAEAVKTTVRLIVDTVANNAGRVTHIHAHRQSSKNRQSDPGSLIWQTIGLWAQTEYGLFDGGGGFAVGDGLVIPEAWDARYVGNRY